MTRRMLTGFALFHRGSIDRATGKSGRLTPRRLFFFLFFIDATKRMPVADDRSRRRRRRRRRGRWLTRVNCRSFYASPPQQLSDSVGLPPTTPTTTTTTTLLTRRAIRRTNCDIALALPHFITRPPPIAIVALRRPCIRITVAVANTRKSFRKTPLGRKTPTAARSPLIRV